MSGPKTTVGVVPVGPVAGVAWLTAAPNGVEMFVVGKITFALEGEGNAVLSARPELPGHHGGVPAPDEIDTASLRSVIVRGRRAHPGRAYLRRGPNTLVEAPFDAGAARVAVTQSSHMETTVAGRRGDEWLVIEGGETPTSRRWCKVPKLGILATWSDIERLVLTSRACLVDVSKWSLSFVLRASRRLPAAMAPDAVSLSVLDLSTNQPVRSAGGVPASAPSSAPALSTAKPVATLEDEEGTTKTHIRAPVAPPPKPLDDDPTEPKTRLVPDLGASLPKEALADPKTVDRPKPRPSSAGLRIGRASSPAIPAVSAVPAAANPFDAIHDEPTRSSPMRGDTVSRAFSALKDEAGLLRAEVTRRIAAGAALKGLVLKGAPLSGLSLVNAQLGGLDLTNADLSGADLRGADLTATRLDGAKLDGAKLEGADLMCATMRGATLRKAALEGANFAGADLTDAQLEGAGPDVALRGATLTGVKR